MNCINKYIIIYAHFIVIKTFKTIIILKKIKFNVRIFKTYFLRYKF